MSVCSVGCVGVHLGVCALQHMVPLGAAQSQGHCATAMAYSVALSISSGLLFSRLRLDCR